MTSSVIQENVQVKNFQLKKSLNTKVKIFPKVQGKKYTCASHIKDKINGHVLSSLIVAFSNKSMNEKYHTTSQNFNCDSLTCTTKGKSISFRIGDR